MELNGHKLVHTDKTKDVYACMECGELKTVGNGQWVYTCECIKYGHEFNKYKELEQKHLNENIRSNNQKQRIIDTLFAQNNPNRESE